MLSKNIKENQQFRSINNSIFELKYMTMRRIFLIFLAIAYLFHVGAQTDLPHFDYLDVFGIEYASDPQVSPSGDRVVYVRKSFDIMSDKQIGSLWTVNEDGTDHRKLTSMNVSEYSPVWSPSGDRIAFLASTDQGSEIFIYWLESQSFARISQLEYSPSQLCWSPDGKNLAFNMFVAISAPVLVQMPRKPKGAKWASAPRLTTRLKHEADGSGYIPDGFSHIFIMDASGGTPRKLSSGDYQHRSNISWSKESDMIFFSANRGTDPEFQFRDSNIFSLDLKTREIKQLTAYNGPAYTPQVSPDGKRIAFLGYEDKVQTYQLTNVYVMNIDGTDKKQWVTDLDRSITDIEWRSDSEMLYFSFDDKGVTKIGSISNAGFRTELIQHVGGTTIGRPYASGSFSVSGKNMIVYTATSPYHPSELKSFNSRKENTKQLTNLNDDLLGHRKLGKVESIWYTSSVDKRALQGWIIKPPNYEEGKTYPLMVENHGGPILNYGERFTAELQLLAAQGYLVFYPNPRGSTSYGEEFGNLLYDNYPGDDYQDVMDGVDYLIAKGYASEDQLFVSGGSAGGIMTAWIIGKNNRFEAAVVQKPVINWISKTLVADNYYGYADYRYPGQPWESFEKYWNFSPISLVGNVETPTMVMVGMNDLRTPPSEAKQFYHALKLRKIETMLVEIPGASHGIARRPSNLISKIAHTVAWCDKYRTDL